MICFFLNQETTQNIVKKVKKELGLDSEERILLYAPTWRSDNSGENNPDDPDSYFPNSNDRSYNLFHIDAMYDLLRRTYTDVVIKKKRTANERAAFIDMVEKHRNDETPIIFTADRGYESYNDMAHVTECGHKSTTLGR